MDFEFYVEQCMEDLRAKTGAHDSTWGLGESAWSVDQHTGTIIFDSPRGFTATCPVQIIGTYNTEDSTWLWAWDNPSINEELTRHAAAMREFGEEHDLPNYTHAKIQMDEEQCWEFVAVACRHMGYQGAYRGPAGTTMVFMTFGEVKLSEGESGFQKPPGLLDDSAFDPDIPDIIRATVMGLMTALHQREIEAFQKGEDGFDEIKADYLSILNKWCVPDLKPQGIAYGNQPRFNPEREKLVGCIVQIDEDDESQEEKYCVRTRQIDENDFETVYEYILREDGQRLLVEQIFYVDGDMCYECL